MDRQCLPKNKPRPLTAEDIALRRQLVRQRHAELQQQQQEQRLTEPQEPSVVEAIKEEEENQVFIAFARVFSGTLRKGQQLYVLGPKYNPSSRTSDNVDDNLVLKVTSIIFIALYIVLLY